MAQPILSFFSPGLVYCFELGKYKSLRWRPMYDKPGEFELHTSPSLFSQVESGQLILRPDRPKETVKVEGIAIEDGDLIITGRFLSCVLEDAGITSVYNFDCPITEAMEKKQIANQEPAEGNDGTFWDHIRYWTREEFRCRCGEYHAPYCNGFPVEPNQTLVELLDDIRGHFGRPAHRSSGIRCQRHNADQKNAASNSRHLYGKAMDFYVEGFSGETIQAFAAADPRCNYAYVIEGNMVHVDVK